MTLTFGPGGAGAVDTVVAAFAGMALAELTAGTFAWALFAFSTSLILLIHSFMYLLYVSVK